MYWSIENEVCECKFQVSDDPHKQFNLASCDFECLPQDCENSEQFYWDSDSCACACFVQECDEGFTWHNMMCTCLCDGPSEEGCPSGEVFDESCCACKPCEKEECEPMLQYWNPVACSCECLPRACSSGQIWVGEPFCSCHDYCIEEMLVAKLVGSSDSGLTKCSEVSIGYFFNASTCTCGPL
jgi:hypothetical protein